MEGISEEDTTPKGVPSDPAQFFDDMNRIEARMDSRRKAMLTQQHADDVKAEMCNKIQDMKRAVPGLRQRIIELDATDPELVQYIIKLEGINGGIWCPKCDKMKQFGGVPTGGVASAPQVPSGPSQQFLEDISEMNRVLENLSREVRGMRSEYEVRIQLLQQKVIDQQKKLARLETVAGVSNDIVPADFGIQPKSFDAQSIPAVPTMQTALTIQTAQTPPTMQTAPKPTRIDVSMVKKEDLPAAPTFDIAVNIDALIDEKFAALSSDDMLN